MTRFPILFLLLVPVFILAGQERITGFPETVPWSLHFQERNAEGDIGPGTLLGASDTSNVTVARLEYVAGRNADIYYPAGMTAGESRGAVILVSGDSDSHVKAWCGRTLKDTVQYLQWGQMIAEAGMVAIAYELGNPQSALETLTAWIVGNAGNLGIDAAKLAFFGLGENGCSVGMETVVTESRHYSGPKPACAVFYYGMLPLRSSKQLYPDVPVMTVRTRDYMYRGIPESMDKFNARAARDGAMITAVEYPEGVHWFDCKDDVPRSREIIGETVAFLADSLRAP